MATKRRRLSFKKAAPVPSTGAPPMDHPLLSYLDEGLSRPSVKEFLQRIEGRSESAAGVECFDTEKYKASMEKFGEYTCNVNFLEIPAFTLCHEKLVPGMSAVRKVQDSHWPRNKPCLLSYFQKSVCTRPKEAVQKTFHCDRIPDARSLEGFCGHRSKPRGLSHRTRTR